MKQPWDDDTDADCMKDFIEVMHEQFSPEAFRKLYSNTPMNTFTKGTRCPFHPYDTVIVGSGCCWQCPHYRGEADEGKSVECALGGPTTK